MDSPSSKGEALARAEASILSPLRYPGSKRRLAVYIAETLRLNGLQPKLFVEPFAGGASVALCIFVRYRRMPSCKHGIIAGGAP